MAEREIVRRNGQPVMFTTQLIQYIETGKKKDPQLYTPSCKVHRGKCRKLRHL
jgi:hypothetical protein